MPKRQATSRSWSTAWFHWNDFQTSWKTSSPNSRCRIDCSASANSRYKQDRSCLRFLWRPRTNELVQIYAYQRLVFGAKSSSTCANCAPNQVGFDNQEMYPISAKAIQNNFYMDDFIKSIENPEEAIDVFSQLQNLLSHHGFPFKKWISNRDEVCNAIPAI